MKQKLEFPDYKSHASAIRALMAKGAVFNSSVFAGRYFVECEKNALKRKPTSGKTGKVIQSQKPRKFGGQFAHCLRFAFFLSKFRFR